MKNEPYVLIMWDDNGNPTINGVYPNNDRTFNYAKSLVLEHVQEVDKTIQEVPSDIVNYPLLVEWYEDMTPTVRQFWRMDTVSIEDAPIR